MGIIQTLDYRPPQQYRQQVSRGFVEKNMQNLPQGVASNTISLMLGHPDPSVLVTPELQAAISRVLEQPEQALQYGTEQGNSMLIDYLAARIRRTQNVPLSAQQMVITAGSTQANDLIGRLYTRGGSVIVEAPTYADAIHIYRDHGVEIHSVPMDEQGASAAELEALLKRLPEVPRLFYTIPNFHNPTGITTSEARRREILRLAREYGFRIVEDDVYRELAFDAPPPPSYFALAQAEAQATVPVMQIGSFSKTLAPGLRLGWIASSRDVIESVENCGTTQMGGGASPFTAAFTADYCCTGAWEAHVERLQSLYKMRRDTLLAAMERHMPAGVTWTTPAGGFFVWVTLPEGARGQDLKRRAAERGLMVAAGEGYFINREDGARNLRLTYSFAPPEQLEAGVKILAEVIAVIAESAT
jgi:2-aminoadipate transaminase